MFAQFVAVEILYSGSDWEGIAGSTLILIDSVQKILGFVDGGVEVLLFDDLHFFMGLEFLGELNCVHDLEDIVELLESNILKHGQVLIGGVSLMLGDVARNFHHILKVVKSTVVFFTRWHHFGNPPQAQSRQ